MEQSILKSTKKLLGIGDDDTSFDLDIITHINSAFSHLQQLGLGPRGGFVIEDEEATWQDFLPEPDPVPETYLPILSAVKTNLGLHVRLDFDPPQIWHILNATTAQALESDTRLLMLREQTEWINPNPAPTETDEINELIMRLDSQVID
jgi:hypothetical protein